MSVPAEILAHPAIWRGNQPVAVSSPSLPTGFPALDAELPGGGWPTAALVEILPQHEGIGELRILGHALSRLKAAPFHGEDSSNGSITISSAGAP